MATGGTGSTKRAEGSSAQSHRAGRGTGPDGVLERLQYLEQELEILKRQVGVLIGPEALPPGELDLLVCRVGSSPVAFLQEAVGEVVPVPLLMPLPEAPFWVPGLLNLRGSLVPVVDVEARVMGHPRQIELTDFIVVADVEGRSVGFLVQEILDLTRSEAARIERPRDVPAAPYLMGALQIDDTTVLVLSAVALAHLANLPEIPDA